MKSFTTAIVLTLSLPCVSGIANADEPGNYFKYTCLPELNLVEITTVMSRESLDNNMRKKYNLLYANEFSCKLKFSVITVSIDIVEPKDIYNVNVNVTFYRDGNKYVTVKNFGTWHLKDVVEDSFPSFMTFDGVAVKGCWGLDKRECRQILPEK